MELNNKINPFILENNKQEVKWLLEGKIVPKIRILNFCLTVNKYDLENQVKSKVREKIVSLESV